MIFTEFFFDQTRHNIPIQDITRVDKWYIVNTYSKNGYDSLRNMLISNNIYPEQRDLLYTFFKTIYVYHYTVKYIIIMPFLEDFFDDSVKK